MYFSPIIRVLRCGDDWLRVGSERAYKACMRSKGWTRVQGTGTNIQAYRIFGGLKAMTNSSPLIANGSRTQGSRRDVNRSDFMTRLDARPWHPWLRINPRAPNDATRPMSPGGVASGAGRVGSRCGPIGETCGRGCSVAGLTACATQNQPALPATQQFQRHSSLGRSSWRHHNAGPAQE